MAEGEMVGDGTVLTTDLPAAGAATGAATASVAAAGAAVQPDAGASADPLRKVDLREWEVANHKLTEAKEAVVDALVNITVSRSAGFGPYGEVVYGTKPSKAFLTGFLVPRFDPKGMDETSDIQIATAGADFQMRAAGTGRIAVRTRAAFYMRVIPTYAEMDDDRNDIFPQVQFSRETKLAVDRRASEIIEEKLADLGGPPDADQGDGEPPEEEAQGNGRDDRLIADLMERAEEGQALSEEELAEIEAANRRAERAEAEAEARRERRKEQGERRKARREAVAKIRREAYAQVYEEMGIPIRPDQVDEDKAVGGDVLPGDEALAPGGEGPDEEGRDGTDQGDPGQGGDAPPADPEDGDAPPTIVLRRRVSIPDRFAARQEVPMKWKRFPVDAGEIVFDPRDPASVAEAIREFDDRMARSLSDTIGAWLSTPEGQREAHRPGTRIKPSDFADADAWQRFIDDLVARRPAVADDVMPDLWSNPDERLKLVVAVDPDFLNPDMRNVRIAIENAARQPIMENCYEHAAFQICMEIDLAAGEHWPLRLDRVEGAYRFRDHMTYPAMGINCGVRLRGEAPADLVSLSVEWAPRYVQPRIQPVDRGGVEVRFSELSRDDFDPARLLVLCDEYDRWAGEQEGPRRAWAEREAGVAPSAPLPPEHEAAVAADIEPFRTESRLIRTGIEVLRRARDAYAKMPSSNPVDRPRLEVEAAPWRAWTNLNRTFAEFGRGKYERWRLFQLAFILAHVPTFASRAMLVTDPNDPSTVQAPYADVFDAERDEGRASLLYFPTGGGKSEAFFGLLVFCLFFDRFRGKHRGVTALIRYPLRLLTLQQAQRLMRLLVTAEMIRVTEAIGGRPFEIGFWVGSANTPNRVGDFGWVPRATSKTYASGDELIRNPPTTGVERRDRYLASRAAGYLEALRSYNKIPTCPCCGGATGLRRFRSQRDRVGIVCFADPTDCAWNRLNPGAAPTPLPFILSDDTIYQRSPSVVLGTVDKLALIGQSGSTIANILGMFGLARHVDPDPRIGHLSVPRGAIALAAASAEGLVPVAPAWRGGAEIFHDPFPSLVIQDEGHLLDESLGTFAGLFETTLEAMLLRVSRQVLGRGRCASWVPDPSDPGAWRPRLPKVVSATATVSDPDRQLREIYQRHPIRFPAPGTDLYGSFYAEPEPPTHDARRMALWDALPESRRAEGAAPWMRLYVSVMTNGRMHTMATVGVISLYHLTLSELWNDVCRGAVGAAEAVARLSANLTPAERDPLTALRAEALDRLVAGGHLDVIASILDLHRISLTYVTNKKGGDQIIDTLATQVEADQRRIGVAEEFDTKLISGGITVAEIQTIMHQAEAGCAPGQLFPPLSRSLRNVVATSAISHGVDVDNFNSMFFTGMPSDIAEYIQASSRVGRTHTGFSMLIPTPHHRRDRYILETHDQFHRFLERMLAPPAVQRWASKAIRRVIPSLLQAYLCGVVEAVEFASKTAAHKADAPAFTRASDVAAFFTNAAGGGTAEAIEEVREFCREALGLRGRGPSRVGAPYHPDAYDDLVGRRLSEIADMFLHRFDSSRLGEFWRALEQRDVRGPMTSLRDIDAAGVIQGATWDPYRRRFMTAETIRTIMRLLRNQRGVAAEHDGEENSRS